MRLFDKLMAKLKPTMPEKNKNSPSENHAYFEAAKDWHYDKYAQAYVRGNRYQFAFYIQTGCLILALLTLVMLLPLKTLVPIVIHKNEKTGEVWVDKPVNNFVPPTDAETQADLVRYVIARETYSAADLNQRYHQVLLTTSDSIVNDYADAQADNNPKSPVHVLGMNGACTVQVEDVIFIDKSSSDTQYRHFKQPARNLAQVNFTTTTTMPNSTPIIQHWVATVGWEYRGLPDDKADAWDNWNGFTVTHYPFMRNPVEKLSDINFNYIIDRLCHYRFI